VAGKWREILNKMPYDENQIPVCLACEERSDAEDTKKNCERCGVQFCCHFASTVDFRYCSNCMADFKVIESVETKTITYQNAAGVVTTRRREIARNLKLVGSDWLFANTQISLLSDSEIEETIEYHRAIMGVMLMEREDRRTEQLNKLSKVKITLRKRDDVDSTGAVKKTKNGGTKRTSKQSSEEKKVADALQALLSLSPADLQAVVAGLGIKEPSK
jgi:hypothetical protein